MGTILCDLFSYNFGSQSWHLKDFGKSMQEYPLIQFFWFQQCFKLAPEGFPAQFSWFLRSPLIDGSCTVSRLSSETVFISLSPSLSVLSQYTLGFQRHKVLPIHQCKHSALLMKLTLYSAPSTIRFIRLGVRYFPLHPLISRAPMATSPNSLFECLFSDLKFNIRDPFLFSPPPRTGE